MILFYASQTNSAIFVCLLIYLWSFPCPSLMLRLCQHLDHAASLISKHSVQRLQICLESMLDCTTFCPSREVTFFLASQPAKRCLSQLNILPSPLPNFVFHAAVCPSNRTPLALERCTSWNHYQCRYYKNI